MCDINTAFITHYQEGDQCLSSLAANRILQCTCTGVWTVKITSKMGKTQFLRMPFVIGVHSRGDSSKPQYTHKDQDAFISSVAFLVLLVASGGSLILLQWTSPEENKHILIPSIEIVISLLLVLAIALIISFRNCTPPFVFKADHKDLIILPSEVQAKSFWPAR